jgi:hypothetical protein
MTALTSTQAGDMDEYAMVKRHLEQAEEHVVCGEAHIAHQKTIVAELERDGHVQAAATARALLATFEDTQLSHVQDRDRLRAELAALG